MAPNNHNIPLLPVGSGEKRTRRMGATTNLGFAWLFRMAARASRLRASLVLGVLCLLPAIAAAQTGQSTNITLTQGDVVRITVFGQPDLTTLTRLGNDGEITFPLIGNVNLNGMSTSEAEQEIAQRLRAGGFVRNAQVTLFLEERSEGLADHVTVLGHVARPGRYPVTGMAVKGVGNVVDALAAAGGTRETAADYVFLMRMESGEQKRARIDLVQLIQEGDLSSNFSLQAGDILLVPESPVFYIYGQVNQPGRYALERDMTVMQAVSVASGITRIGNEDRIILRRRSGEDMREYRVDLSDTLAPSDVLYISERRF